MKRGMLVAEGYWKKTNQLFEKAIGLKLEHVEPAPVVDLRELEAVAEDHNLDTKARNLMERSMLKYSVRISFYQRLDRKIPRLLERMVEPLGLTSRAKP